MQAAKIPVPGRDDVRADLLSALYAPQEAKGERQLLDALPIAAAVVGLTSKNVLKLIGRNSLLSCEM